MSKIKLAKHLKENENIITVLNNYFFSPSPKHLVNDEGVFVITAPWRYKPKHLIESDIKKKLEEWANKNKLSIIATASVIIILDSVAISRNNPIVTITDPSTSEISVLVDEEINKQKERNTDLYFIDNTEDKNSNLVIEVEYDLKKGIPTSLDEIIEHRAKKTIVNEHIVENTKSKTEESINALEKEYIKHYSIIYGLDYNKVYEIIREMTNDFKDEEYLNNYIIGDSTMKKRYVECSSKEMAILIAVRNLYWNKEYDNLKTGEEYISISDYSHQISYISKVLGIDVNLNYAICRLESGNFTSNVFMNKNNPSGLKYNGPSYTSFPSKTAGLVEQSLELLKYKIDGKNTIEAIGNVHAPVYKYVDVEGKVITVNASWVSDVTSLYKTAKNNYEELFGKTLTGYEIDFIDTTKQIPKNNETEEIIKEETELIEENLLDSLDTESLLEISDSKLELEDMISEYMESFEENVKSYKLHL